MRTAAELIEELNAVDESATIEAKAGSEVARSHQPERQSHQVAGQSHQPDPQSRQAAAQSRELRRQSRDPDTDLTTFTSIETSPSP